MAQLEGRLAGVEDILKETVWLQHRNEMALKSLSRDTNSLVNKMDLFQDEMAAFKDEMAVFKDEMATFKEEMTEFKEEMRADRREMNKKWGDLANKMGTVVEDIIYPGLTGILRDYFDVEAEFLAQRIRVHHPKDPGRLREFDIIAVAGERLFLNETKSYVRQEYLEAFVQNKEEVFEYLPHHAGKTLVPIFSSLNLPEEAVRYLTKHKCYAMMMGDEHLDIVNFDEVGARREGDSGS
jgi:hypothetical protein